jgi:hypothetical protein
MPTNEKAKVSILSELWMNYRDEEGLADFVEYNDLGLPLSYAIATDIVELTPRAAVYLEETFMLLLDSLEIEDTGFETLNEMFEASKPE